MILYWFCIAWLYRIYGRSYFSCSHECVPLLLVLIWTLILICRLLEPSHWWKWDDRRSRSQQPDPIHGQLWRHDCVVWYGWHCSLHISTWQTVQVSEYRVKVNEYSLQFSQYRSPVNWTVGMDSKISIQGNSGPMVLHKCLTIVTCIRFKSNSLPSFHKMYIK